MKYKIIEINEPDHSIVVRFYTDKISEAALAVQVDQQGNILRGRTDYSINLPVPAPQGDELDALIRSHAPGEWFARVESVADGAPGASLAFLASSVGVENGAGAGSLPVGTPEAIAAHKQARLTAAIQSRLDRFARTRNYDSILSACTYANSQVPKFAAEGQYAVTARDATWAAAYQVLGEVQAQTREMPANAEALFALLPELVWPA
jgi:hypothetical protein